MKKRIPILVLMILAMFTVLNIPMASAAIDDGLIAYYPFDGNALDVSGNNNDGTEYGGLSYKLGVQGDSASFDGIDDYIRVPSDPSLNPVDQLSISFWVKVVGFTNTWSPIVHKGGSWLSDSTNREYTVWLKNTGKLYLASAGDNSAQHVSDGCRARLGYWTHYVGIIDRQNHRMQVYVDGVLKVDANDPYSTFNNNSEDLLIGATEEISSAYSLFKGRVDELRIYDRVLREEEIASLYNEGYRSISGSEEYTFQDFENGSLAGWAVGGRQVGSNWWGVSQYAGSQMAYLHHRGFTELTLTKSFPYSPGMALFFDAEFSINGDTSPSPSGSSKYRSFNVYYLIGFLDKYEHNLGQIWYVAETSYWLTNHPFFPNGLEHYEHDISSLASQLGVDTGDIDSIILSFGSYSPIYNSNNMIVRFDNVGTNAVPVPATIGETIQIPSNYEFILEQNTQEEFTMQLTNPSDDQQSATLEVVNPHSDLTTSLTLSNSVTLAPGEVQDIPIFINAGATPVGIYDDLLLKLTVENGETLYSNIKVTLVEQGAEDLPDLSLHADDIQLADYTLGESATFNAVIHNKGQVTASNVQVQFYELGSLLGETVLDEVVAEGMGTASITAPITTSGEHLIRVVVDFSNAIDELDENNNEASQLIKLGVAAPIPGSILVTGSLPSKIYTNDLFTISGRAVYDVYVDGVRYTNYVVKGGSVQITIKDDAGNEWAYGDIHTNAGGYFAKTVQAPATTGAYQISMTVTDETLSGKRDLLFSVTERPPVLPSPPPPPSSSGHGNWTYVPGSSPSSPGTWTWAWTTPPVNAPLSETDLWVFSDNIHFSRFNPEPGDEITILAEIKYWATSTDLVAMDVPVNFYVTYPGTPKMKIGETVIDSLSVGAPDFGTRYVYTSWKNRDEGIHIIEVEIDPTYVEENHLNNAATRAIIVGELESYQGAIAGQVTDPWGGVANVMVELYDAAGTTLLENRLTDDKGYYLFENLPVDDYQVHIIKPENHRVDAETKSAAVTDQSVIEVDFHLIRQEAPVADAGGPYSGIIGSVKTLDASGSHDPDGEIVTYEWDCDGDGSYELTSTSPAVDYLWDIPFNGSISLKVTDNEGLTATDTALVVIENPVQDICGDLDDDNDVDGDDRNVLLTALNTRTEDPGFIQGADYDGDGLISYNDYREWYACYSEFIAQ